MNLNLIKRFSEEKLIDLGIIRITLISEFVKNAKGRFVQLHKAYIDIGMAFDSSVSALW